MPPLTATLVFTIGIAGLFYLDREYEHTSKALWLPVIWLSTNGSRSLSAWLGTGPSAQTSATQLPATSLLDQLFAGTLILWGIIVLIRRRRDVRSVLKASWPIVFYYCFCPLTLLWSDFPGWGLKRWVRGLGDLIMVLVVATDGQPSAALRRLFSRVGFVLLPASVLLIKYYPEVGQDADVWGDRVCIGVTTNKNTL